jgi:hypothetical protein
MKVSSLLGADPITGGFHTKAGSQTINILSMERLGICLPCLFCPEWAAVIEGVLRLLSNHL